MSTNMELIGRDEINDLEAILSVTQHRRRRDRARGRSANLDAIFTWDYERSRTPLVKLYEKAKTSQWNVTTDLDWSIDVDPEKVALENSAGRPALLQRRRRPRGHAVREVDREGVGRARHRDRRTGCSRSSCTASRARCSAPRASSRPCRGSTPSTTPRRR